MRKQRPAESEEEFQFKLLRLLMTFAEHVVYAVETAQSPDSRLSLEQRVRAICGVSEGLKNYLTLLYDVGLERLEPSELEAETEALRSAAGAEAAGPHSDDYAGNSNHGS
jgi:hypothetical protein